MYDVDLAAVGALLGNPSRAVMLDALMTGRALTAGELARVAGVSPATASEHLARLREGGLVEVVPQGRHRYHRLAGPGVGAALEALSHIAPDRPVTSLRQSARARSLANARTCYDHLAGSCGVAIHDGLLERGWLRPTPGGYDLTEAGNAGLTGWGVDVASAVTARRAFARACLDWTERRSHLAGTLAARMLVAFVDGPEPWFVRRADDHRGLRVTEVGRRWMAELGWQPEDQTACPPADGARKQHFERPDHAGYRPSPGSPGSPGPPRPALSPTWSVTGENIWTLIAFPARLRDGLGEFATRLLHADRHPQGDRMVGDGTCRCDLP